MSMRIPARPTALLWILAPLALLQPSCGLSTAGGVKLAGQPLPAQSDMRVAVVSRSGEALQSEVEQFLASTREGDVTLVPPGSAAAKLGRAGSDAQRDAQLIQLGQDRGAQVVVVAAQKRQGTPKEPDAAQCRTTLRALDVERSATIGSVRTEPMWQDTALCSKLDQRCADRAERRRKLQEATLGAGFAPPPSASCERVDLDCLCARSLARALNALLAPAELPNAGS